MPPFDVPLEENLHTIFANKAEDVTDKLLEVIPNLNHD